MIYLKTPQLSALETEFTPLSRKAILFYLNNVRINASHDFAHTYRVAMIALQSGQRAKFTPEKMQDLFITAIFHDVIRPSKKTYDEKAVRDSAELAKTFCRQNGINEKRAQEISTAIIFPNKNTLGRHLEFADMANLLIPNRIYSFVEENTNLFKLSKQEIEEVFKKISNKKKGSLTKKSAKDISVVEHKVIGKTSEGYEKSLFLGYKQGVRGQYTTAIRERMELSFDLLSMLAITHAKTDPHFASIIKNYLVGKKFQRIYGIKQSPLMKQKITHLEKLMANGLTRVPVFRQSIPRQIIAEHKMYSFKKR